MDRFIIRRHGSITKKETSDIYIYLFFFPFFFSIRATCLFDTHRQLLENCLVIFMRGKRNNVADRISLRIANHPQFNASRRVARVVVPGREGRERKKKVTARKSLTQLIS